MKNYSNSIEVYLEIGETEYKCEVEYDYYPGDPGRYTGPWEDCYPATEPELAVTSVKTVGHGPNSVGFDVSCLLDNDSFLDQVETAVYEELEKEAEAYDALQEDYDESRMFGGVDW